MTVTQARKEAIWLWRLLEDLCYKQNGASVVFNDNQSCIALTMNHIFDAHTKHIGSQHHFVRDKVEIGEIELVFCPTTDMIDVLKKNLTRVKLERFNEKMGVVKVPHG